MISLHDVEQVVDGPALIKRFPRLFWALWFPIDGPSLSPVVRHRLQAVSAPVAISRFGERVARDHGVPVRYAPPPLRRSAAASSSLRLLPCFLMRS